MRNPFRKRHTPPEGYEGIAVKNFEFKNGSFSMLVQHPEFVKFASGMARFFKDLGGDNFVTVDMFHPDIGPFEITIQRTTGKSTTAILVELRERIKELEEELGK